MSYILDALRKSEQDRQLRIRKTTEYMGGHRYCCGIDKFNAGRGVLE